MKIRDNETGEVFEYGTNIHHALRISENGGCLTFENLQNGDGSLKSGDGGYSFVLDDGKTPKESNSPGAIHGMPYANIGGFHGDNVKNDGWISVEDHLPNHLLDCEVTLHNGSRSIARYVESDGCWMDHNDFFSDVIAWKEPSEPYRPERSEGK